MKLSKTQAAVIEYAKSHGGKVRRFDGGFWAREGWPGPRAEQSFTIHTIRALVEKGLATYSKYADVGSGPFPVEITLASEASADSPK